MTTAEENPTRTPSLPPECPPDTEQDIILWLVRDTIGERFIDSVLVGLCERLRQAGMPLARASMNFDIRHPQWRGARLMWRHGFTEARITTVGYDIDESEEYIGSPMASVEGGAEEIRRNLESGEGSGPHHRLYTILRDAGMTDYVAWPMLHTLGQRHAISFACERPGGFTDGEIRFLKTLVPLMGLVSDARLKNRMARTLLETYVGPHASQQILDGAITRGSGGTVNAAVMVCDMRDFTVISDLWPRDDVIGLLNDYFDAICGPVESHGGEILKFMGDGLLAIFPLDSPDACANLLGAISEARTALAALGETNAGKGRGLLGYGIGVHAGEVMYGNIGSRNRLDFTVIGPAVNIAARLESLTRQLGRQVLLSRTFAELAGNMDGMEHLGPQMLKGLSHSVDVFALH